MSLIPQQPPGGNTMFESFAPQFFLRISKEEVEKSGDYDPDAALGEKYFIEVSASGLVALDAKNPTIDQREIIASATVYMTETHSDHHLKSCTIEQLKIATDNRLTKMSVFAAIIQQTKHLCIAHDAGHLAITRIEGACSGLLKCAGFNLCDCELVPENARVGFQLCVALPSPARSPASGLKEFRSDFSAFHTTGGVAATAKSNQPVANTTNNGGPFHKTEYCMYWIRRGECDFMQKGCNRMHGLPLDEEERLRIGVREIPGWFKESQFWRPFLEHLDPSERDRLTDNGLHNVTLAAQSFGSLSDRRHDRRSSSGGGVATTTRSPFNTVESPHEHHNQQSMISNFEAETSHAGPSSATGTNNSKGLKAVIAAAGRRSDRNLFQPPAASEPSGRSGMRGLTEESSKVSDSGDQKQPKVRGRGRNRYKTPAKRMQ